MTQLKTWQIVGIGVTAMLVVGGVIAVATLGGLGYFSSVDQTAMQQAATLSEAEINGPLILGITLGVAGLLIAGLLIYQCYQCYSWASK